METAKKRREAGLVSLYRRMLWDLSKETLIEKLILATKARGRKAIGSEMQELARSGGKKRAEKYNNRKAIAAEKYRQLSSGTRTPVSAQRLYDALVNAYPKEEWNFSTLRRWHALMKKCATTQK